MRLRLRRVSDVYNLAVEADQETDPARHGSPLHPHAVSVDDFSIRIGQQAEIEVILRDELLMAVSRIETHSDNLDIVAFQRVHPIAQPASLLRATRRIVLRVEIE